MNFKDPPAKNAAKSSNLCCHYCRVSSKRRNTNKEIKVSYQPCSSCRMSYCHLCLKKHLHVDPEEVPKGWTCQRCNNTCCCQFSVCNKDHQHCYTYRRTQQRHAQAALKWTKKKKRVTSPEGDLSDENTEPTTPEPTPKRKKQRSAPPTKLKIESSNSEEEYIPDEILTFEPPTTTHTTTCSSSLGSPEPYPVLSESLHFFPLETTTILPTDFLTEKNFLLSEGDKEIKEEPEMSSNSMWDWI